MKQILSEKSIVDEFVKKLVNQWHNWNATGSYIVRIHDVTQAIEEICRKYRSACCQIVRPTVAISTGRLLRFNSPLWQIEVDPAIGNLRLTENEFATILTSAFDGLCDAEIKWYHILRDVNRNVIKSNINLAHLKLVSSEPGYIYDSAYSYIKTTGGHSITDTIQYNWNPKTIGRLIADSCRQHGLHVTIYQPIPLPGTPGLGNGAFIWPSPTAAPLAPAVSLPQNINQPCFLKSEYNSRKIKAWDALRKPLSIDTNVVEKKWMHLIHMDWRVLDDREPDLLVNGKFPRDWKKISVSLVSNEILDWTYIYKRKPMYPRGGGLRVGYILDVPSQNILSTNPEDVASIGSEEHMKKCKIHPKGTCEIACYIKARSRGKNPFDPKAQYVLKDLLTPEELIKETRKRRGGEPHQNEILAICPAGTPRKNIYEGMNSVKDVRIKGIYLVVDKDDPKHLQDRDLRWAKRIAEKNNLPIFQTHRTGTKNNGHAICMPAPKQGVHFNHCNGKIITKKLSEWKLLCKTPLKSDKLKTWQHVVHMDKRVLSGDTSLITNCRFPGDWKKISASLVSEKTPDWTYNSNGYNPIRVGYILDVPAQNILSTDPYNVVSINSESHIRRCNKRHKSGQCHILCYVQENAIKNHSGLKNQGTPLHALESLLTPKELISEQKIVNPKRHNELLIMGPGTSDRILYEGMERTAEVKVKAIYLVVNKNDLKSSRDRDLAWVKEVSKKNKNLPIFTVNV